MTTYPIFPTVDSDTKLFPQPTMDALAEALPFASDADVDAVTETANDTAAVVNDGRLSEDELSATIADAVAAGGGAYDQGTKFVTKLNVGAGDSNIAVAGDSTGNASNEWPSLLINTLSTEFPAVGFTTQLLNQDTDLSHYDWLTETVITTGQINSGETVLVDDTFTRTAADLRGSTADTGQVWGGASNNAGDWVLDGTGVATRTTDATSTEITIDGLLIGDTRTEMLGAKMSTTTPPSNRVRTLFAKYLSATNNVSLVVQVTTGGVVQALINKRIANVVTSLTSQNGVLTAGQASVTFDASLQVKANVDGTGAITAVVNGNTLTATLTSAEMTALVNASQGGFGASLQDQGGSLSEFKLTNLGSSTPAQRVKLFNGSKSGSTLQFQTDHMAALYPASTLLDVLLISSCHNYGGYTPAQYFTALDAFVDAFKAVHPESGIVVCSQNPEKPGTLSQYRAAHLARLAELRSHCALKGYGYIPVIEAFSALSDRGWSLINSDGIHPSQGEGSTGSALWRDTAHTYLTGIGLHVS